MLIKRKQREDRLWGDSGSGRDTRGVFGNGASISDNLSISQTAGNITLAVSLTGTDGAFTDLVTLIAPTDFDAASQILI